MKTKFPILFLIPIFLLIRVDAQTLPSASQRQPIDNIDFWAAIRSGSQKTESLAYRKTTIGEFVKGENRTLIRKEVREQLAPNRFRLLRTEYTSKGTDTFEMIRIEESYFCRVNKSDWKKSDNWCGPSGAYGYPADARTEAYRETGLLDGKPINVFHLRAVYRWTKDQPEKESYTDIAAWIDSFGKMVRYESSVGSLNPDSITYTYVDQYQYGPLNPKLSIEAPIK